MADIGMVGKILWEDYYKIAWVNILTGEYQFVKILDTDEEKPCLAAKDIYEYSRPRSIFSTRFSVSASA